MTAQVYMVAMSTPPAIVCPDWCDISDVHLGDSAGLEGMVTHLGTTVWNVDGRNEVRCGVLATPAGEVVADSPRSRPNLQIHAQDLCYDDAEDMARAILAFVASEREAGR